MENISGIAAGRQAVFTMKLGPFRLMAYEKRFLCRSRFVQSRSVAETAHVTAVFLLQGLRGVRSCRSRRPPYELQALQAA